MIDGRKPETKAKEKFHLSNVILPCLTEAMKIIYISHIKETGNAHIETIKEILPREETHNWVG